MKLETNSINNTITLVAIYKSSLINIVSSNKLGAIKKVSRGGNKVDNINVFNINSIKSVKMSKFIRIHNLVNGKMD